MKKAKKVVKEKTKNLVVYVEDSTPRTKVFDSKNLASSFVKDFVKKYPDPYDGYWVDLLVTDIKGTISFPDREF